MELRGHKAGIYNVASEKWLALSVNLKVSSDKEFSENPKESLISMQ